MADPECFPALYMHFGTSLSMQQCSVTEDAVLHTVGVMDESWQVRYLRHVEEVSGRTLSAIAKAAGVSSTTLTRPVNDPHHKYQVKLATLEAVQRETGIRFGSFQDDADEGRTDADTSTPIALVPVYDVEASAGPGLIPPDHEAVAYRLQLPADYLRSLTSTPADRLQVISVKGTSMLPTLKPGDLVMVDPAKDSLTYDGLFVIDVDGAVLVKRIGRSDRAGWVRIKSDNPEDGSFERAVGEVRVIGKVVWRGVKE